MQRHSLPGERRLRSERFIASESAQCSVFRAQEAKGTARSGQRRALTWIQARFSMRSLLLIPCLVAATVLGAGCQSGPAVSGADGGQGHGRDRQLSLREKRDAAREAGRRMTRAVAINRNLIYTPRWTRAEDLATTLQPLLDNMYGPSALVLPHTASNKLVIHVPDEREREHGGAAASARTRSGTRGQPASAAAPRAGSRTGRTARTTSGRR